MQIEVKMNKEIMEYREAMFFGLDFRQMACSLLAVLAAVGIYFSLRGVMGEEVTGWLCMLGAAPFAFCGFFRYHGMTAEQFAWAFIKSEFLYPKRLLFQPEDLYYQCLEERISNGENGKEERNAKKLRRKEGKKRRKQAAVRKRIKRKQMRKKQAARKGSRREQANVKMIRKRKNREQVSRPQELRKQSGRMQAEQRLRVEMQPDRELMNQNPLTGSKKSRKPMNQDPGNQKPFPVNQIQSNQRNGRLNGRSDGRQENRAGNPGSQRKRRDAYD